MMGDAVKRMRGVKPSGNIVGYLYGGVGPLPDVNEVWDKSKFENALIAKIDAFDLPSLYQLAICPRIVYNGTKITNQTAGLISQYMVLMPCPELDEFASENDVTAEELAASLGLVPGVWTLNSVYPIENMQIAAEQMSVEPTDVRWVSHDILNADGSTYLAASEPVPVYE